MVLAVTALELSCAAYRAGVRGGLDFRKQKDRALRAVAANRRRQNDRAGRRQERRCGYDLGSGDDRIVIAAAKKGAQAVGFDIDPDLVVESAPTLRRRASRIRRKSPSRHPHSGSFSGVGGYHVFAARRSFAAQTESIEPAEIRLAGGFTLFDMGDWRPTRSSGLMAVPFISG